MANRLMDVPFLHMITEVTTFVKFYYIGDIISFHAMKFPVKFSRKENCLSTDQHKILTIVKNSPNISLVLRKSTGPPNPG